MTNLIERDVYCIIIIYRLFAVETIYHYGGNDGEILFVKYQKIIVPEKYFWLSSIKIIIFTDIILAAESPARLARIDFNKIQLTFLQQ